VKPYYDHGGITIYLGDCMEVLPQISGVNCTIVSPPYNTMGSRIPRAGTGIMKGNGWLKKANLHGYGDDMPEDEYQEWQRQVAALVYQATVPGGAFYYNHKIRHRDFEMLHPLTLVSSFEGWRIRQEIIWSREQAIAFNARMFAPSDERVFWMWRPDGDPKWNQEASKWMSVWRISPLLADGGDHPCPFPNDIPARCMTASTDPGDLVLDMFMGSGTVLRVAKDLGRRCIGIEREERFAEIAVKRLAQEVLF
jgi:DNA modification methylase